jgi:hypothetical protein
MGILLEWYERIRVYLIPNPLETLKWNHGNNLSE